MFISRVFMCEILKILKHLNERNDCLIARLLWFLVIVPHTTFRL